MHKQDNTTTDKGLNTIVESMYGEDYMDDPTLNPDWQKAHRSASLAKSMDDKGETEIAKQVRAKGINASKTDIDHHNQYMMDQDLLQPIHQAASIATDGEAKNFNEWLIIQIKDEGDGFTDWFIEKVINKMRFRD